MNSELRKITLLVNELSSFLPQKGPLFVIGLEVDVVSELGVEVGLEVGHLALEAVDMLLDPAHLVVDDLLAGVERGLDVVLALEDEHLANLVGDLETEMGAVFLVTT